MSHFIFIQQISVLNILNMLYISIFSLQNAVYFIMLPCLVSVLLTFEVQGVLKLKKKKSVAKRLIQMKGKNLDCIFLGCRINIIHVVD